jgi:exosortase/archaeosortase family protein
MTYIAQFDPVDMRRRHGSVRRWKQEAQDLWRHASPRTRATVQLAVLFGVVMIAYNYSLSTLIQNAGLETPLAYVSLVPAIALALAAIRSRPLKAEPQIHDRQVDYIIGVPLIVVALAANVFLPQKLSAMFWVWRIDLLTLPFFVAGAVAIIFGVRILWRQKLAIGYLFLGWPYPYESVLLRVLDTFTTVTLWAITAMVKVVHVATVATSTDGTLFVVVHKGHSFPLSVVSACSGVNSVVGFLLIGSAFGAVVRGPLVRKLLWLVGGMFLLWCINLGRILFIFWAGRTWGEHVALDILHPFIGLVTFSAGIVVLVALIRPLGMEVGIAPHPAPAEHLPLSRTGRRKSLAVPKVYAAVAIVTVVAIIIGLSNLGLKSYNLVADTSGRPKLTAYISDPVVPRGWTYRRTATFDWAKPLFGDTSIWDRYVLRSVSPDSKLPTSQPVIADVIVTPDLESFAAYGVEACYQFHGYALRDVAQVNVGGGVTGQAMSYTSQTYGSWSIVYWIVPVKLAGATTYERIVLYIQNRGAGVVLRGLSDHPAIENVAGSLGNADAPLIRNRLFLVAFARAMIQSESQHPANASLHFTERT